MVNPVHHRIFWLKNSIPLVYLAIREAHGKLECRLGIQTYVNACQLIGISALGLSRLVE